MSILTRKLAAVTKGMLNLTLVKKEVTKKWRKKARCLENLTNQNKDQLQELKLQLLQGLNYENQEATKLYEELKKSPNITAEQNKFAKFLYENYPDHSIKKMGFD